MLAVAVTLPAQLFLFMYMHSSHCYIAGVNTKHDWLICGHVTSDKCNVSRRATSEKLLHVHK
jgi:hypothetical protein